MDGPYYRFYPPIGHFQTVTIKLFLFSDSSSVACGAAAFHRIHGSVSFVILLSRLVTIGPTATPRQNMSPVGGCTDLAFVADTFNGSSFKSLASVEFLISSQIVVQQSYGIRSSRIPSHIIKRQGLCLFPGGILSFSNSRTNSKTAAEPADLRVAVALWGPWLSVLCVYKKRRDPRLLGTWRLALYL
jgi:hypothetical protein